MSLSDNPAGSKAPEELVKPTSEQVDAFHENSDVDLRQEAQHHTLGAGVNQAAPGNHNHRGGDSEPLLTGVTLSGSRATDAWRLSVEAALVQLGATSSSTP